MGYARVQAEPFSVETVLRELQGERVGGVTLYVGTVRRQEPSHTVDALTYEAYPEMAQASLDELRKESIRRFGLVDAIVIHRTGRIAAGEPILLVALAGAHRGETFDAVRDFMDRLKEVVPIWKREEGSEGQHWIVGRERRKAQP